MKEKKEQTTQRVSVGMAEFMEKYGEKRGIALADVIREIWEWGFHHACPPTHQCVGE